MATFPNWVHASARVALVEIIRLAAGPNQLSDVPSQTELGQHINIGGANSVFASQFGHRNAFLALSLEHSSKLHKFAAGSPNAFAGFL